MKDKPFEVIEEVKLKYWSKKNRKKAYLKKY